MTLYYAIIIVALVLPPLIWFNGRIKRELIFDDKIVEKNGKLDDDDTYVVRADAVRYYQVYPRLIAGKWFFMESVYSIEYRIFHPSRTTSGGWSKEAALLSEKDFFAANLRGIFG